MDFEGQEKIFLPTYSGAVLWKYLQFSSCDYIRKYPEKTL